MGEPATSRVKVELVDATRMRERWVKPRDQYYTQPDVSQYGTGVDVLRQLRDQQLGGPVEGEAVAVDASARQTRAT